MDNLCDTCEENKKLDDNFCIDCHLKYIQYGYNQQINYIELYDLAKKKKTEDLSEDLVYSLNQLQKNIVSILKNDTIYDSRIHSKCPCGKIHDRNLDLKKEAHHLKCENCGWFCSNCQQITHAGTCDEYQKILFNYRSNIIQNWKSTIRTNIIKLINNEKEKESNEVIKKFLNKSGNEAKICPYCTYDGALEYEDHQILYGRKCEKLTRKYNRNNWYKVACKSSGYPVTKTNCSDVTCGVHNKERKLYSDGISKKCCGRRINWDFWTPFNPVFDPITFEKSKIIDITTKNYASPNYRCNNCQQQKTCVSIKCLDKNCKHYNHRICGNCICRHKKFVGKKLLTLIDEKYNSVVATINQSGNSSYKGTRNGNEVIFALYKRSYMTDHYLYKIKPMYNSVLYESSYNDEIFYSDKPFINLKHGDKVSYKSTYLGNRTSCVVLVDAESTNYSCIDCIEKDHLFEFYGKECLELAMNKIRFEKEFCDENAAKLQKWYKTIQFQHKVRSQLKEIIKKTKLKDNLEKQKKIEQNCVIDIAVFILGILTLWKYKS